MRCTFNVEKLGEERLDLNLIKGTLVLHLGDGVADLLSLLVQERPLLAQRGLLQGQRLGVLWRRKK